MTADFYPGLALPPWAYDSGPKVKPQRKPVAARRCALYRHRDADERLLYVGISVQPSQRAAQHALSQAWFEDVATIQIEWFDSEQEARQAETLAIAEENPAHNRRRPSPRGSALTRD